MHPFRASQSDPCFFFVRFTSVAQKRHSPQSFAGPTLTFLPTAQMERNRMKGQAHFTLRAGHLPKLQLKATSKRTALKLKCVAPSCRLALKHMEQRLGGFEDLHVRRLARQKGLE